MGSIPMADITIGIISDTHGDEGVCRKIWQEFFKDVDLVVHAGDVLYHGPRNQIKEGYNPAGLLDFLNTSPVPLLVAKGNCDSDVDRFVLQHPMSPFLFLQFGELRIMVEHGDALGLEKKFMVSMGRKYGLHLFITGHTHERILEREENMIILNPGSPSLPKGDGIPSIALLGNGRLQVINVLTGATLNQLEL